MVRVTALGVRELVKTLGTIAALTEQLLHLRTGAVDARDFDGAFAFIKLFDLILGKS